MSEPSGVLVAPASAPPPTPVLAGVARAGHGHGPVVLAMREFARHRSGLAGAALLITGLLIAIAAPLIAPYDPVAQIAGSELRGPSARFLMGTDNLGRDLFSRIVFGTRVSVVVGVLAVAIGASAGAGSGLLAGYIGGAVDNVIMRVWDALFAMPGILIGVGVAAVFGASAKNAAIALGIASMPTFARLARSVVIAERSKEYVQAARALGARHRRILGRHILPNALGPLLVQMALAMAGAVLLEASLSFLGLGTQPPDPSWGRMLADSRQYLGQAPWYGIFPGVTLTLLVLGLNSCADALRDALDPRTRLRRH